MTACVAKFVTNSICLADERPHLLAVYGDSADKLVLLEHRDDEKRATAAEVRKGDSHWIAVEIIPTGPNVLDVGDLSCPFHVTQTAFGVWTERPPRPRFNQLGRCVVERNGAETVSVVQIQHAELGPADARRMPPESSQKPAASSPGVPDMRRSTSEVAACCSSASASFFSKSTMRATCAFACVPLERRLGTPVRLFAPLRDKVTSSAQSLVPFGRAQPRIKLVDLNRTAR